MPLLSMLGFSLLLFFVTVSVFYFIWMSKRQKLERESYLLQQLVQTHFQSLLPMMHDLEPLMAQDRPFYEELQGYIKARYGDFPVLGSVDSREAKRFYSFLTHLEQKVRTNISAFSLPIIQQLEQMRSSLMQARESFAYVDHEYKVLASSFPVNIMAKMLED
jgi:hypothetical protein